MGKIAVLDNTMVNMIAAGGKLADVVPTFLKVMGLAKPAEMTGKSLLL